MHRARLLPLLLALSLPAQAASAAVTPLGRLLDPAGRLTAVGDVPSGGALTPDGRFFWAIDSGHGQDAADVVDVASGALVQRLPLPGAYGAVAFAKDGRTAYISGEPRGAVKPLGP